MKENDKEEKEMSLKLLKSNYNDVSDNILQKILQVSKLHTDSKNLFPEMNNWT